MPSSGKRFEYLFFGWCPRWSCVILFPWIRGLFPYSSIHLFSVSFVCSRYTRLTCQLLTTRQMRSEWRSRGPEFTVPPCQWMIHSRAQGSAAVKSRQRSLRAQILLADWLKCMSKQNGIIVSKVKWKDWDKLWPLRIFFIFFYSGFLLLADHWGLTQQHTRNEIKLVIALLLDLGVESKMSVRSLTLNYLTCSWTKTVDPSRVDAVLFSPTSSWILARKEHSKQHYVAKSRILPRSSAYQGSE